MPFRIKGKRGRGFRIPTWVTRSMLVPLSWKQSKRVRRISVKDKKRLGWPCHVAVKYCAEEARSHMANPSTGPGLSGLKNTLGALAQNPDRIGN